jgi:hypothetical protein
MQLETSSVLLSSTIGRRHYPMGRYTPAGIILYRFLAILYRKKMANNPGKTKSHNPKIIR